MQFEDAGTLVVLVIVASDPGCLVIPVPVLFSPIVVPTAEPRNVALGADVVSSTLVNLENPSLPTTPSTFALFDCDIDINVGLAADTGAEDDIGGAVGGAIDVGATGVIFMRLA